MKKNLVVIAGILVVMVSASGRAQEKMSMPMPQFSGMGERMTEELKLTDEQKKEVDKLRFEFQKQMIAQGAKLATMWVEYRQLLSADLPDKATLEKKFSEMADGAGQLHSLLLNHWFSVNKLLNADQQKVWKKALESPMSFLRDAHPHMRADGAPEMKKEN
ncbi:MAG TPA: periplasmic heavy metal sensor [Bacteroidota bacterium]|nr:periplasmic heavy metal sensor [Bacteroidota bacterium]